MNYLDQKINKHFAGLVVRKDLVKAVRGNAVVPTYVLEYLLGQYCATSDEASLLSGIETVKDVIRQHFVHRNEANLVKSMIREKGRHRVIDKISVELNEKADTYEATFSNLGIKEVLIDTDTIKKHPKLLVSGVWCIADLEYKFSDDSRVIPWIISSIKPIQMSNFDFDYYLSARKEFLIDEWIDLLIQSIGFNPGKFDLRGKLLMLMRLVPYCERNYNIIELGPKGTGKSHIYSDFSPHGILISGGEVTVPKLFVNNTTGRIGLVGYWDIVAFDEFAGRKKQTNNALVDILKNYMANKSFSRGIETLGAEASLAFVGNTTRDLEYMLMHSNLFSDLPLQYYDSAFLDRVHFYIPGWEIEILRNEMFTDGYGFVVDYLAEILRALRNYDYSQQYMEHFELLSSISSRDRDGINKSLSGLIKILYPDGIVSKADIEPLLVFAIEGRKRVKDQLMRIDTTYSDVEFGYIEKEDNNKIQIKVREEEKYPQHYYGHQAESGKKKESSNVTVKNTKTEENDKDDLNIISKGESNICEFKTALRWNNLADRPDKNVEHSVLKTLSAFFNTEGGILFIGVNDKGEPIGIDINQFPSEDKYLLHFANLFNEKIGKQYLDIVHYELRTIKSKRVLKVDCKPSSSPVFMKSFGEEEFYIRNGPSSVKLSPSEVLAYCKKHFR
jgi:ATP-dependent Lon protease